MIRLTSDHLADTAAKHTAANKAVLAANDADISKEERAARIDAAREATAAFVDAVNELVRSLHQSEGDMYAIIRINEERLTR